jgi:hypothetical protein
MPQDPPPAPEERERIIEEAFSEIDGNAVGSMRPLAIREERRSASPYHQEPWPPSSTTTKVRRPSSNWSLVKIVIWALVGVALFIAILYLVQIIRSIAI